MQTYVFMLEANHWDRQNGDLSEMATKVGGQAKFTDIAGEAVS
jgi:hypothetical protein